MGFKSNCGFVCVSLGMCVRVCVCVCVCVQGMGDWVVGINI